MKITYKNYDSTYERELMSLADLGLAEGYLTEDEVKRLCDSSHYCHIATDENDRLCALSYGRYVDKNGASSELRCGSDELEALFPDVGSFAIADGCVTLPERRGDGIAPKLLTFSYEEVFRRADVVLYFVWNRHGGEKPAANLILNAGGEYYKSVPEYWYDYDGLNCPLCGGRCKCTCDIYYLRKNADIYSIKETE